MDTAPNIFKQKFTIRYSEGDRFGRLKLRPLFDYAQEIGGNHAATFGISTPMLQQRNLTWMISRMKYHISEYPRHGEEITIVTYPHDFDKMFARREFRFYRQDGCEFAKASNYWLIVSLDKHKIVIPDDELKSILPDNSSLPIAFDDLCKLRIDDDALPFVSSYEVRENMLDINCHLNNAECGAFLQNMLGAGSYAEEVQVNYVLSIPPDSKLDIKGMVFPDKSFQLVALLEGHQAIQMIGNLHK